MIELKLIEVMIWRRVEAFNLCRPSNKVIVICAARVKGARKIMEAVMVFVERSCL